MKIGLIDLNTGNLASLESAMRKLDISFKICKNSFDFDNVEKIILPGVGAFKDFMDKIKKGSIDKIIRDKYEKKIPILGICVGFQVLFSNSSEHGLSDGLGILEGSIINFQEVDKSIPIPHVGWNDCKIQSENNLFHKIEDKSDFYFTHSYFLKNCDKKNIISTTNYKTNFISAIQKNNLYGVQFHPEKSQESGLKILKNFNERC